MLVLLPETRKPSYFYEFYKYIANILGALIGSCFFKGFHQKYLFILFQREQLLHIHCNSIRNLIDNCIEF